MTSAFGATSDTEPFRGCEMLSGRLFGAGDGWPPTRPAVQRVDIGRLLSEAARGMLSRAASLAADRGAPALDALDLLRAAADTDPARSLLARSGLSAERLTAAIAAALPPPGTEAPSALTPSAKRAILDAQRIGRDLRASYIGPEHLLLALAADPDSPCARILADAGVDADRVRRAIPGPEPGAGPGRETATPALDEFGRDLTEEARRGTLDPVVGREDEIEAAIEALSRRRRSIPLLIGDPGVGKSAIVEGIAQRVVNDGVPGSLIGRRLVALDLPGLVAGPGDPEDRVRRVLEEARLCGDRLVIFLDGVHAVLRTPAGALFKPALARDGLRVIAATPVDEHRRSIEKDAALERRFQPIPVREPTVVDTVGVLSCLRDRYEAHHQVCVTEDALDAAAELSDRYIPDRFLPDKAVDVLDQACARVRLRDLAEGVRELGERIAELGREKDQAIAGEDYERAQELRERVEDLRAELDEARRAPRPIPRVRPRDVAEVVAGRTGIPVARLTELDRERLLRLEDCLHERVVGQDAAVRVMAQTVRRARAGLADPDRPVGAFLFLGPPGVGKTELAKAVAAGLFGGEEHLVRIDMAEFRRPEDVPRLESGRLAEAVRRRPHTVVLLSEIDRACPDALDVVTRILEHGRLDDRRFDHGGCLGDGDRTADFSNTIVIMTSTLGSRLALGLDGGDDARVRSAAREPARGAAPHAASQAGRPAAGDSAGNGSGGDRSGAAGAGADRFDGHRSGEDRGGDRPDGDRAGGADPSRDDGRAGPRAAAEGAAGTDADRETAVRDGLARLLRVELLDRIDEIVVFRWLDRDQMRRITRLLVERTRRRLAVHNIAVEVAEDAIAWLADRGQAPGQGARRLRRTVRRELDDRLSNLLIDGQIGPGDTVVIGTEDGELDIQVRMPVPPVSPGAGTGRGGDGDGREPATLAAAT